MHVYKDIAGKETIGYGHLLKPGEKFTFITKEEAVDLLRSDVAICESEIVKNFGEDLLQCQFDALASFGFNCGTGVYKNSSVATAIQQGKFEDVPAGLFLWCKAFVNGKKAPVEGLLDRREHEASVFCDCDMRSHRLTKTELMLVQKKLKAAGLYTKTIDGKWGPNTEEAVTNYLKMNNIAFPVRPIVDRFTAEVIRLILE